LMGILLGHFRVVVIRNSDYFDKLDIFKPLDKTKFFKRNFSGSKQFNTTILLIPFKKYLKKAEKQWEGKSNVEFELSNLALFDNTDNSESKKSLIEVLTNYQSCSSVYD
ncbi:860_t:CDS:2, partial [Gigaspora rosea]